MKYILRYETKSKYMGFSKVHYLEFEDINNLIRYLLLHNIKDYKYYVRAKEYNIPNYKYRKRRKNGTEKL